jgi:ADP-heptose:LPS heptosyltransferase
MGIRAESRDTGIIPAIPEFGREPVAGEASANGSALPLELTPKGPAGLERPPLDTIQLRRLGRGERTFWGPMLTVRGLEAIRGYCLSATPFVEVRILINGEMAYRGRPLGGYELAPEFHDPLHRKYVFNIWMDFGAFAAGKYTLDIELTDVENRTRSRREYIVVAPPIPESQFPDSDGLVNLAPDDSRSPEEQVNSRPSTVRPGRRKLLPKEPQAVLIQRTDQLGDLVVALPAIRRLREIFPKARLVGLVSPANVGLAESFGLFDELVTVSFGEDRAERRRVMAADEQRQLREKLAPYQFDLAIDLSENVWSRPLLLLSGAPFLVGFRSGNVALDVEVEGFTHDRFDNHEVVPHTNKLLGLVEWLAAMLRSEPNLLPHPDPDGRLLALFGLEPDDRYVVLHDGARLRFSQWPYYRELAELLLAIPDLRVIWITDDDTIRGQLPPRLTDDPCFTLVDQRPPFEAFDILLARCAVFIGNDSGPKHLASLRGAKVVSIHMARNNWNEWGQENGGLILSRKVPCAGCLIHHDPEECGKDFACIRRITPDEVFAAVQQLL